MLLDSVNISQPDMISIGTASTINAGVVLKGYRIAHKGNSHFVTVGSVQLGRACCVLPGAVLQSGVCVEDGQIVHPLDDGHSPVQNNHAETDRCWAHSFVECANVYLMIVVASCAAYPAFRLFSWMLAYFSVYPWASLKALHAPELSESNFAFMTISWVALLPPWYGPFIFVFQQAGDTTVTPIPGDSYTVTLKGSEWLDTFVFDILTQEFGVSGVLWILAVACIAYQWCMLLSTVLLKWTVVYRTDCYGVIDVCSQSVIRKLLFERLWIWSFTRFATDRPLLALFLKLQPRVTVPYTFPLLYFIFSSSPSFHTHTHHSREFTNPPTILCPNLNLPPVVFPSHSQMH